jgi:hypothetical protein
MNFRKITSALMLAETFAMRAATPAFAEQARPWLCRDKPVFSSNRAMKFEVTARPGRQWKIFFMQFSPDAAHDGFDIVNSHELSAGGESMTGRLEAGRYFAVALYRGAAGHWICPDYSHDDRTPKSGAVSNLCYGADGPPCLVDLNVMPDQNLAAPAP